jgi:hypothetical protein
MRLPAIELVLKVAASSHVLSKTMGRTSQRVRFPDAEDGIIAQSDHSQPFGGHFAMRHVYDRAGEVEREGGRNAVANPRASGLRNELMPEIRPSGTVSEDGRSATTTVEDGGTIVLRRGDYWSLRAEYPR